ncbi:MAG: PepSY domain-containing protein [Comamonas sp.]|nr:PepSY domain-containing protein [Comamonas sp.]
MITIPSFLRIAAAALLSISALHTFAQESVQCPEHPKSEWRTEAELQAKLVNDGWKVRRVEESCTCLKAYGTNPAGKRIAAYFDPKTLELIEEE